MSSNPEHDEYMYSKGYNESKSGKVYYKNWKDMCGDWSAQSSISDLSYRVLLNADYMHDFKDVTGNNSLETATRQVEVFIAFCRRQLGKIQLAQDEMNKSIEEWKQNESKVV